jgi:hypothetical protein
MLALIAALAVSQTPIDAPAVEEPLMLEPPLMAAEPPAIQHQARFFTAPRVSGEALLARTGMAMLLGAIGGGVGIGFIGIGHMIRGLTQSVAPVLISVPFAAAALGVGTALGAALFGDDYKRDFADAIGVALMTSLISVAAAVSWWFLAPVTVVTAAVVSVAMVFPAIATPLTVQTYKPDGGPVTGFPLATF